MTKLRLKYMYVFVCRVSILQKKKGLEIYMYMPRQLNCAVIKDFLVEIQMVRLLSENDK